MSCVSVLGVYVQNFLQLCTGAKGFGFKGSAFHRCTLNSHHDKSTITCGYYHSSTSTTTTVGYDVSSTLVKHSPSTAQHVGVLIQDSRIPALYQLICLLCLSSVCTG